MASDPKVQSLPKRCAERVVEVRIAAYEGSFILGNDNPLHVGKHVHAMALHPAGLCIVPKVGPKPGKRVIVPMNRIEYAVLGDEEQ